MLYIFLFLFSCSSQQKRDWLLIAALQEVRQIRMLMSRQARSRNGKLTVASTVGDEQHIFPIKSETEFDALEMKLEKTAVCRQEIVSFKFDLLF